MSAPALHKQSKFKQGYFNPVYPEKYMGDIREIKYRSGYEYKFMIICDRSPKVKRWASEPMSIEYISPLDGRKHKYWCDFWLDYGDGVKRLIEVKPLAQTKKPIYRDLDKPGTAKRVENYNYAMKQYIVNIAKWQAAAAFCEKVNWTFHVVTEKDLEKLNS